MLWILFIILHLIGLVGYTVYLRKSALTSIDKSLLAALMQTAVFIPSIIAVTIHGGINLHLALWQWATLVLSAGFIVGIQFLAILMLKHLEISVYTIIFNLRLLFITLFGFIVLGELPTPLQLLGGTVIFASIVALNLHRNRRYASRPIVIGILGTLFFSAHATFEKFNIVHVGFFEYLLVSGGLATLALWIWVWRRRVPISRVAGHVDVHTLQLLALRTMSAWGYLLALTYGSVAVTNYVSGMSVPLTVIYGVLIFKERGQLREKVTATLVAVLGLTLILISRLTGA